MMKKLLLTAVTGILASAAMAQVCTPDPGYTPTSATGAGISPLPNAVVNVAYNESATIVIPTSYNYNGFDVDICKVRVDSVTNFPSTQSGNPPAYTLYYEGNSVGPGTWLSLDMSGANDRACVRVADTFDEVYNDSLRAWASVQLYMPAQNCAGNPLATVAVSSLNDGQGIGIAFKVNATGGVTDVMSNNSFDVAQNYPNPFNGESQIAFNVPSSGKVTFRVTNLVGKTIKETNMNASAGVNYINISSAEYAAGVYMYSVSFEGATVTKRMIIK